MAESTDPLLRTAYLIVWDLAEAEDLVQECLLTVARSHGSQPGVTTRCQPLAHDRTPV